MKKWLIGLAVSTLMLHSYAVADTRCWNNGLVVTCEEDNDEYLYWGAGLLAVAVIAVAVNNSSTNEGQKTGFQEFLGYDNSRLSFNSEKESLGWSFYWDF